MINLKPEAIGSAEFEGRQVSATVSTRLTAGDFKRVMLGLEGFTLDGVDVELQNITCTAFDPTSGEGMYKLTICYTLPERGSLKESAEHRVAR